MKRSVFALCSLVLVVVLISCGAKQPLPPPDWSLEEKAIHLRLTADPQLNIHKGTPHTLHLCIYQLKTLSAFDQLAGDEDGIYQLLDCRLFEASAARSKKLTIQPGQELTIDVDRAEGARYLAVVAGYFRLEEERIMRRFEVPIVEEKKGFLRRSKTLKPGPLSIEIVFGPEQILSSKGN